MSDGEGECQSGLFDTCVFVCDFVCVCGYAYTLLLPATEARVALVNLQPLFELVVAARCWPAGGLQVVAVGCSFCLCCCCLLLPWSAWLSCSHAAVFVVQLHACTRCSDGQSFFGT
jgi:hypothetical protein